MATTAPRTDLPMADPASRTEPNTTQNEAQEPKYGGFTRFEIELEFVQCLANPYYLLHLATLTTASSPIPDFQSLSLTSPAEPSTHVASAQDTTSISKTPATTPLLAHPPFIAYLSYLRYFSHPPYLKYLTYPGPTLKNLELLQSERFRREVLSPDVVGALVEEGRGAVAGGGGVAAT